MRFTFDKMITLAISRLFFEAGNTLCPRYIQQPRWVLCVVAIGVDGHLERAGEVISTKARVVVILEVFPRELQSTTRRLRAHFERRGGFNKSRG